MKTWKKGDINPETGRIFWSYSDRNKTKEQWYSPEIYEKRVQELKNYYNSPRGKAYHKRYYQENKDKQAEKARRSRDKLAHEYPLSLLYSSCRLGALRRELEFSLTREDVNSLWEKQGGKCYYSGLDMNQTWNKKHPQQVSMDRLDTKKGYTLENVVLCCQALNYAKNSFSLEVFQEFLEKLKKH